MALASASAAFAQPTTIPRFDFDFSNPGARSLGFGGAFAALADDATAAYANPAGLAQLTRREVSFEGRYWHQTPTFLFGGRVDGAPTGIGLDTRRGADFRHASNHEFTPSFASVVLPKGPFSFALYGHQVARFEIDSEAQGFFFDLEPGDFPILGVRARADTGRRLATRESVDLKVATAGAAVGWRLNDHLSLGLGVAVADVSVRTASIAFGPDDDSQGAAFGEFSFLPENQRFQSISRFDGTDVVVNLGTLWRVTDRLTAAAFFRRGARADGSTSVELDFFDEVFRVELRSRFSVPDVWGAGVAYRSAGGRLTLAAEADHVGYEGFFTVLDSDGEDAAGITYVDGWEFHVGGEWAFLGSRPLIALRAGSWLETNEDDLDSNEILHWAAGVGLALERFQVDLGIDLSDEVDTASLSVIYTF